MTDEIDDAATELDNILLADNDAEEENPETPEDDEPEEETLEEEEPEEGEEADEPEEPLFTIWDDDGPRQVTEEEAKSATMRMRDYTQKTMEASERRKEAEAALEARNADRETLKGQLAQWAVNQPAEPDWQQLAQTLAPQDFNLERVRWEQRERQQQAAQEQYQALVAEQEAEVAAERDRQQQDAVEQLKELYPEWRDPKVAAKEVGEVIAFGKTRGFSEEELQGMTDPRMVRTLREAMLHQRMTENTASLEKRVAEPGKALRPGGKTTGSQKASRKQEAARKAFHKSGSIEDALKLNF